MVACQYFVEVHKAVHGFARKHLFFKSVPDQGIGNTVNTALILIVDKDEEFRISHRNLDLGSGPIEGVFGGVRYGVSHLRSFGGCLVKDCVGAHVLSFLPCYPGSWVVI